MTIKAYSYLRFSTPEQSKGDSYRRQTENARQYAERHGLELDETLTFQDMGVSAFRGLNAKVGALGAFLEGVQNGTVPPNSYLLIESLDRLSRDAILEAQTVFQQIILSGITIVSLIDNKVYSRESINNNPIEVIAAILSFIRSHEESAVKSRRVREAWSNKRKTANSKVLTSQAPSWLKLRNVNGKRKFQVIEERADVIRRIFRMTLSGVGQNAIEKTFNSEGVPVFGRGKRWHRSFIVKILSNPAVIGTFIPHTIEYKDGKKRRKPQAPVPNYFPTILDNETFSAVQSLRVNTKSPMRGRHAGKQLNNIFGGLARCPICGGTATLVNKGKRGKPYLVCQRAKTGVGCNYKSIRYEIVENAFLDHYEEAIHFMTAGDAGNGIQAKIESFERGIDILKEQINKILYTISPSQSPSVANKIMEMEAEIESNEKQLRVLYTEKDAAIGTMLNKRIEDLRKTLSMSPINRNEVNVLLRQILSGVTINYQNGTIDLLWKHGGESSLLYAWPMED